MQELITHDEFVRYVIPHIRLIGWWPEGYGEPTDSQLRELIWKTIHSVNYNDWKLQSALFDTFGTLNLDAEFISHAVSSTLKAYQTYKHARNHGIRRLRIIRDRHTCGWSLPELISIEDMTEDYDNPGTCSMLIPFPLCPHNQSEGGGLCTCSLLHEIDQEQFNTDPEFGRYLKSLWDSAT